MSKTCWGCGHFLVGGGCWKDGEMLQPGWKNVEPDDTCGSWVPEGTKGTVTDFEGLTDGDEYAENEYLKDDESNL